MDSFYIDPKNFKTVEFDTENEPLIIYDPVHAEKFNIQTGEVIES